MITLSLRRLRWVVLAASSALLMSGCGFTPYDLPLPGGADIGDHPYTVKAEFRDAMDLVPQGGVRSDDVTVGRITDVTLKRNNWTAVVTMKINGNTKLPDNTLATIRQTSLLGEKFVSLDAPDDGSGYGRLGNGDVIGLSNSGRNPELEEVLSATALLFNGGGLDKINTITRELNNVMGGRESDIRDLIKNSTTFTQTLDNSKYSIINTLAKVNSLAVNVNRQEDSIDAALRDVPPALKVLDDQRHDLVKMLEALDDLSDVATDVIKKSRRDTITDLKRLRPFLKGLADAGDSLVFALRSLLLFPFSDAVVKDNVQQALAPCPAETQAVVRAGVCEGDYWNNDIDLTLTNDTAINLLKGLLSISGITVPGFEATAPGPSATAASGDTVASGDPTKALTGDVADTVKKLTDTIKPSPSPSAASEATESKSSGGVLCNGLGLFCRAPEGRIGSAQQTDLGKILMQPAVTK